MIAVIERPNKGTVQLDPSYIEGIIKHDLVNTAFVIDRKVGHSAGLVNGEVANVFLGNIEAPKPNISSLNLKEIPSAWKFWKSYERNRALVYNHDVLKAWMDDCDRGFAYGDGRWYNNCRIYLGRDHVGVEF